MRSDESVQTKLPPDWVSRDSIAVAPAKALARSYSSSALARSESSGPQAPFRRERLDAATDLVPRHAEVGESLLVGQRLVFAVGVLERPVEALRLAEEEGADLFGAEGDDEVYGGRVDVVDRLGGLVSERDPELRHGLDREWIDTRWRGAGRLDAGLWEELAREPLCHLGAGRVGDAEEEEGGLELGGMEHGFGGVGVGVVAFGCEK